MNHNPHPAKHIMAHPPKHFQPTSFTSTHINSSQSTQQLTSFIPTSSHSPTKLPPTDNLPHLDCPIQFGNFNVNKAFKHSIGISLSPEVLQTSRKLWENSLILDVGGLRTDTTSLRDKLDWVWKLNGHIQLAPMGNNFFILNFDLLEDRWRALLHGPCIIFGHFISIRTWVPRFSPTTASKDVFSPIWIKLPGLPIEFFDRRLLVDIAKGLGTFLGIDGATHSLTKITYARICVLCNLSQHLPSSITVDGMPQPIIFEGASGFCNTCHDITHSSSTCRSNFRRRGSATVPPPNRTQNHSSQTQPAANGHFNHTHKETSPAKAQTSKSFSNQNPRSDIRAVDQTPPKDQPFQSYDSSTTIRSSTKRKITTLVSTMTSSASAKGKWKVIDHTLPTSSHKTAPNRKMVRFKHLEKGETSSPRSNLLYNASFGHNTTKVGPSSGQLSISPPIASSAPLIIKQPPSITIHHPSIMLTYLSIQIILNPLNKTLFLFRLPSPKPRIRSSLFHLHLTLMKIFPL